MQSDPCQPCGGGPDVGLEYVGAGRGDFAMEPQMKYVGYGGDYAVRRSPNMLCCLVSLPLCLLALLSLLAWCLWPFDECKKDLDNWQIDWSKEKQTRCCARGFPTCAPAAGPPQAAPMMGPVDPYNCA